MPMNDLEAQSKKLLSSANTLKPLPAGPKVAQAVKKADLSPSPTEPKNQNQTQQVQV